MQSAAVEESRRRRRGYAERSGWPADLSARQVAVLNLLAAVGLPLRLGEINQAFGLYSRGGAWAAVKALLERGLVARMGNGMPQAFVLSPGALSIVEERRDAKKPREGKERDGD